MVKYRVESKNARGPLILTGRVGESSQCYGFARISRRNSAEPIRVMAKGLEAFGTALHGRVSVSACFQHLLTHKLSPHVLYFLRRSDGYGATRRLNGKKEIDRTGFWCVPTLDEESRTISCGRQAFPQSVEREIECPDLRKNRQSRVMKVNPREVFRSISEDFDEDSIVCVHEWARANSCRALRTVIPA